MENDQKIWAKDLSKTYEDGTRALNSISFNVPAGCIYAMLGGNGAGKTTTINIFLNFLEPSSGQVFIDGIDCVSEPLKAKSRMAYVSENVMLYSNLSAIQNLDFFTHLARKTHYSRKEYENVLSRVGLQGEAFDQA